MKEKSQMLIYFIYPKKYQKFFCLQTIVALYVLRIQFFVIFLISDTLSVPSKAASEVEKIFHSKNEKAL